jgi:hypothetical protein
MISWLMHIQHECPRGGQSPGGWYWLTGWITAQHRRHRSTSPDSMPMRSPSASGHRADAAQCQCHPAPPSCMECRWLRQRRGHWSVLAKPRRWPGLQIVQADGQHEQPLQRFRGAPPVFAPLDEMPAATAVHQHQKQRAGMMPVPTMPSSP